MPGGFSTKSLSVAFPDCAKYVDIEMQSRL
jgi:hypothetical protein